MQNIIVGLLAVTIGGLFCVRGYVAMRTLIPLWGSFAGFLFGAGLIDATTDDGFLRSALAWLVGLGFAILFGALAYLYYEVSIVLAMSAVGFALGVSVSVTVALGVRWSWVIVLVGLLAGASLAVLAVYTDLPAVLLVVLTATGGASAVVFGLMLLTDVLDTAQLDQGATTERIDDDWWWYAAYVALAVLGVLSQAGEAARRRMSPRDQWSSSGGRQLRAP